MKKNKLITFLILLIFPFKLHALIEVDITRGNLNPLPIAVSALYSDKQTTETLKKNIKIDKIGDEISLVIENNLKETGLFNPLEKKAFLLFNKKNNSVKIKKLKSIGNTILNKNLMELKKIIL